MVTRKIGKLLRGKATPTQFMIACVLGALIGFMPGFAQSPGLMIVLILLLAVLNANLFLAATVGLLAKLVSLAVMPLTFMVGRILLDGPTSGLFALLINAPVGALMGFENYVATGGLVTGTLFGILAGMLVIRGITAFRMKMTSMQENSERYKTWTSKWWVKALTFVFVGGGGKKDYKKLLTKRIGNPFRIIGVIGMVLFVVLLLIIYQFASGPIVTAAMQRGLERANGATVDVRDAELDLAVGRLVLHGFAMADPNDLTTDLLRADRMEADISGRDLLRKRIALDQVQFANASTGETRAIPGRRIGRWPEPKPVPDKTPEEKTLEEYIQQAEVWRERLAQVRQWVERMSGPEEAVEDDPAKRRETLRERLERQVAERGYANVRATHLVKGAPTFMVYRLDAEQVRAAQLNGATVDIRGRNLSTHPHLADEPPSVLIESSDDRLRAFVSLDHAVSADTTSTLEFFFLGLDTDTIVRQFLGDRVIRGGTMDLFASGNYGREGPGWIDLPLRVAMHDPNVSVGGSNRDVSLLEVPIGLRGPLDNLMIMLDDSKLADALVRAGATELARQFDDQVGERIEDVLEGASDQVPGLGDSIREGAGRLFPGRNRD